MRDVSLRQAAVKRGEEEECHHRRVGFPSNILRYHANPLQYCAELGIPAYLITKWEGDFQKKKKNSLVSYEDLCSHGTFR